MFFTSASFLNPDKSGSDSGCGKSGDADAFCYRLVELSCPFAGAVY